MNPLEQAEGWEKPVLPDTKPTAHELWQRYHTDGPGSTLEEDLVKKYLPLVKTVVGRLAITLPPHVETEDLYSAGLVGLLSAVRQYDPKIGTAFEPYARLRIRGAVLDELRRMDWVPRSVHAKARKVQSVMGELEQRKGRLPTDEEVAAALNLPLGEYQQLLDEIRPATYICLDAVPASDGEEELSEHETLADESQRDAGVKVLRQELSRLIAERIEQLPEIHRKVLALYYFEDYRLREIAAICGLCESRICQIHTQAILSIRTHIEQHEAAATKRPTPLAA
jgi:RNA polymerase sigma factor FliA